MLKRDLVEKTTDSLNGYLKKDISKAVDIIIEAMSESLNQGNRVEFSAHPQSTADEKPQNGKSYGYPAP